VTLPDIHIPGIPGEAGKLITVILPDDGRDLDILKALRQQKGIIRADSMPCYASTHLAEKKTKRGKLPEPVLARIVEVLVANADAEEIFRFVCEQTDPDHPEGTLVYQTSAPFCTPYTLPEGVPDERE
jgi:hypothetical protein